MEINSKIWIKTNIKISFNNISYWGSNLSFHLKNFEINTQYLAQNDDNPFFIPIKDKTVTKGFMIETVFYPKGVKGNWVIVSIYNWIDSELKNLNYQTASLNLTYLLRRNIKSLLEFTYDFEKKFSRLTLGLISAF